MTKPDNIILDIFVDEFIYEDNKYSGYTIKTNQETINIGIEEFQDGIECFGCLTTNDDINEFKNKIIHWIRVTDTSLLMKHVRHYPNNIEGINCDCEIPNTMFITIKTSAGDLQFVLYNIHNGYYGHDAVIVSNETTEKVLL